jgi:hypothetical protein
VNEAHPTSAREQKRSQSPSNFSLALSLVGVCFLSLSVGCEERDDSGGHARSEQAQDPTPPPAAQESASTAQENTSSAVPNARTDQSWTLDDPGTDGWESEVLAQQAERQLKSLGSLFFEGGEVTDYLASDFTCDPLVPNHLQRVFEDDLALVERSAPRDPAAPLGGAATLTAAFKAVRAQAQKSPDDRRHSEFKITTLTRDPSALSPGDFQTEVLFSLSFPTGKTIVEHHANWTIAWSGSDSAPPKLQSIAVKNFARTTTKRAQPLFSDVTASALASNPSYSSQLAHGMNYWLSRLPVRAMLNRFGTPGLALGDVNGDGLDDLYLCQEPGLPNRLFLQQADGTAREVAAEWGVDWLEDSRAALLLDLDNDGDQDLALTIYGNLVIARNVGGMRFEVATALPASSSTASLAAADYDGDGWLDLFVCAYVQEDGGPSMGAAGERFVYHDAKNGAANSLFHNEGASGGKLTFRKVTQSTGLDVNNRRWSFAASWEDFDDDGDQDLYVANDYGRNNLYRNDGGHFVDVAAAAGVEDSASGMSVAWGDCNRDGRMDLYVSNMFSAAGSRITTQQQFKSGTAPAIRNRFRRFARGNSLFRNGGESFQDVSLAANVNLGRWAWSSNFVDLNNDAWLDLVVANGYLSSNDETGDL